MALTIMNVLAIAAAPLTILSILIAPLERPSPELTRANYRVWMKHIQPVADELRWKQMDWQPDLASGIEKAAESGKPILLWTMNGHPFGCT